MMSPFTEQPSRTPLKEKSLASCTTALAMTRADLVLICNGQLTWVEALDILFMRHRLARQVPAPSCRCQIYRLAGRCARMCSAYRYVMGYAACAAKSSTLNAIKLQPGVESVADCCLSLP